MRAALDAALRLLRRLRMLVGRRRFERELAEEMELHRELSARERAADGIREPEARAAAARAFGNALRLREQARDAWGWRALDELAQDVRFALRALRRSPGFAAVAITTLALGLGAATAMFSVVRAVLLRPLPFPHSERLLTVGERTAHGDPVSVSYPDYLDWRTGQRALADLGLYRYAGMSLTGTGTPERLQTAIVTSSVGGVLGWTPRLGRTFRAEDDAPGAPSVLLLSESAWRTRFAADPAIVGRALTLAGKPRTVVGVLPDVLRFPDGVELWVSVGGELAQKEYLQRANHIGFHGVARLAPGRDLAAARADLERVATGLAGQYPQSNAGLGVELQPLLDSLVGASRQGLLLLLGAVGLLLLVVCANLANLLLARGEARAGELSVRRALGAGSLRLLRQLITESVLLAGLGATLGVAVAWAARGAIGALAPLDVPRFAEVRLDAQVLAGSALAALSTALLFGVWPAVRLVRSRPETARAAGRATAGRDLGWMRRGLVAAQVALTLTLLLVDGLLWQSLARLRAVPLGYETRGVTVGIVDLSDYGPDARVRALEDRVLADLRGHAGVEEATLTSAPPLDADWQTSFDIGGQPDAAPGQGPTAELSVVEPAYFRTMDIPLRRGQVFDDAERHGGPVSAIVDERTAERCWPGQDPLGKRLDLWRHSPYATELTVVGVVPTVRLYGFRTEPKYFQIYLPRTWLAVRRPNFILRSALGPDAAATLLREAVHRADPELPVYGIHTLAGDLAESLRPQRLLVTLSSAFAGFALALAGLGLYGVVAYGVGQRRRELGIRAALGARPGRLIWMVLRETAAWGGLGLLAGLAGGFAAAHLATGELYGIAASDPLTFTLVPAALALVLLAAGIWPSRRAATGDLLATLRAE